MKTALRGVTFISVWHFGVHWRTSFGNQPTFCLRSSHYCYRLSFPKVSNNRIYFRANQCNKYPSCGLSQKLRINDELPLVIDDKRRSRLPPSISAMEVFFEIEASFFNILQHLFLTAFILCFQPIRWKVTWGFRWR